MENFQPIEFHRCRKFRPNSINSFRIRLAVISKTAKYCVERIFEHIAFKERYDLSAHADIVGTGVLEHAFPILFSEFTSNGVGSPYSAGAVMISREK